MAAWEIVRVWFHKSQNLKKGDDDNRLFNLFYQNQSTKDLPFVNHFFILKTMSGITSDGWKEM